MTGQNKYTKLGYLIFFLFALLLTPTKRVFGESNYHNSVLSETISTEPAVRRWLCDIDGDDRSELISFRMGKVFSFIEVKKWQNSSFQPYWQSEELGFFEDASAGDIDQDGIDELVAVGYSKTLNSDVLLIVDYEDETFLINEYRLEYRTELVAVGDINNDGQSEIVTVRIDYRREDGSRETILINKLTADGLIEIDASTGHSMTADVYVDDFDGDGIIELLVAESKGEPSPVHPEKFGPVYSPLLNVYRWDSEGLSEKPVLTKVGFAGMPYPRITVQRTPKGKRILFAQPNKLQESYMESNTISDPVELLKLPENIFMVSAGDIDGDGYDNLVIETWTFDGSGPKVGNSHGKGALRIYGITEAHQEEEPTPKVESIADEEQAEPESPEDRTPIYIALGVILLLALIYGILRTRKR